MPRHRLQDQPGYLMIDHRASPGVPQELIDASGLPFPAVAGGQMFEADTAICSHCGAVVVLNPHRERPRGYCPKCHHYICDNPGCAVECIPFDKVLDDLQNAAFHQGSI